jgi:hypothetical protein
MPTTRTLSTADRIARAMSAEYGDTRAIIKARRAALLAETDALYSRNQAAAAAGRRVQAAAARAGRDLAARLAAPQPWPLPPGPSAALGEWRPPKQGAEARAAFLEDLEWLVDSGERIRENLAARLGLPNVNAFERRVYRYGAHGLLARTYSLAAGALADAV